MAKKKKNVDFQKVKLKVGKSLKKNTNVTDVSFKTRKIILKDQLNLKTDHQPLTHRKLSLKELFTRLRHHSTAVRHDALMGMKELFIEHPEVVISSVSVVMEKIAEMVLDKDNIVRKAALKALEAAFKCVGSDQVMPFFPILKSYLNCAATHILIDIQDDSLPLLDLLLKHFPTLATSNCSKVLECLLERLAHRPTKMLTMQSRALLLRVNDFLLATKDVHKSKCHAHNAVSPTFMYSDFDSVPAVLLKTHRTDPFDNSFHLHQISLASSSDNIVESEECAISFMNAVHPLLVEVLTEIKSSNLFHPSVVIKDLSLTLELFENTLNVINLLEACAKICDLKTKSNNALELLHNRFKFKSLLKFMTEFPFRSSQTKFSKMNESSCIILNILMITVFITTFPEVNAETEDYYNNVVEYIVEIFTNDDVSGVGLTEQALNILTKLSKINISHALSEKLLQSLHAMHKKRQVGRKDRNIVMKYITSVALSLDHNIFKDSPTFAYWLSSLPLELVEVANKAPSFFHFHIWEAKLLAVRCSSYLQGLQNSSLAVIGTLITVTEKIPDESSLLSEIVELISLIPELSVESFLALTTIIQKSFLPEGPILHLVQLLHRRFIKNDVPGFDSEAFIGFLLSISLGALKQDINPLYLKLCQDTEISALKKVVPSSMTAFSVIPSDQLIWQRHMKLVERTSDIILSLDRHFDNLSSSIEDYLGRGVMQFPCLPMHTAASVLILQCKLAKKYSVDNGFRSMIVELAFSLLLHSVAMLKIVPNCESQVDSALKIVCQFLSSVDASVIICDIMLSRLKVLSEEQLATLCSAWCFLLNINLLDAEQMLLVNSAFQTIEFQSPAVAGRMWWKELNYLFSAKMHLLNNVS